ncbi:uncharacterized protein F4822DRAFT_185381 [Hypoxylon trugodes]|uniref:uncharacterized protein n=1 Tax=Hypoxylon trugodes TaxID=326681 RepID=UPI00219318AD|nr:uncharacterized protein F4822DRAFT_185381 [Hypoxylon trugodes]KAI1391421.1 hypothetical protein F4822DRAFT_185381 [Hypoxylon trugodes]
MPSLKTLLTSAIAAALPLSASAYISNLQAPESAKAGTNITATLTASDYIQNWDDFGIVWGLAPAKMDCGDIVCVGQRISYTQIFPDNVPALGQFTVEVPIPDTFSAGEWKLWAAIPYLVGASGEVMVQGHSANLTIEA